MSSSPDTAATILDHVDNITVAGDVFREPANEYWALVCLKSGMDSLYHQASRCDQVVKQQVNPDGNLHFMGGGNLPEFKLVRQPLLTCAFHWYAISACQYVRTVGAIAHRLDSNRPFPPEYVKSVIPEVLAFRDKVAAHFAWSTKNSRDNDAERLASILPQLTFTDDSFHVAAFATIVRRRGKVSNSKAMKPWSLCRVHEALRQRYWPDRDTAEEAGG